MNPQYHYLWFKKESQAKKALEIIQQKIVKSSDDVWFEASESYDYEVGIQFLTDEKLTPEQMAIINDLDAALAELDNDDD